MRSVKFRLSRQRDGYSCGAHCAYMILRHFGVQCTLKQVRAQCLTTEQGTNVAQLTGVLRFYGLKVGVRPRMTLPGLRRVLGRKAVVIVHVDGDHFSVCYGRDTTHVHLADPQRRSKRVRADRFSERWSRWGLVVSPRSYSTDRTDR